MSKLIPSLPLKIAIIALLVFHRVELPAQNASANPFTGTPSEQLAAARARLTALGSYRERRDYSEPNPLHQIIEFSGKRQRWISEPNSSVAGQETIWEGGRSASRSWPNPTAWHCWPPIDDRYVEPQTTVRLGPIRDVNGRAIPQYVEEFTNEMVGSKVIAEEDVDATTGLPVRVTHTETGAGRTTRYVGEYFDLGVKIEIVFPAC